MPLAISIRQPWAWLIIHGGKDIENRSWATKVRGRVLVHASKGLTQDEYHSTYAFAVSRGVLVPSFSELSRGGIVGSVEIVDCVRRSGSRWFMDQGHGFVLQNPIALPFRPYKGALGFFQVPEGA